MWTKRKKLLLIISAVFLAGTSVVSYFYFRPPQTLSDVVGHRFMAPDKIVITDASNGNKKELEDKNRDELLERLREAEIQDMEYIDIMDGGSFIQFFKGDDCFMLDVVGDYCFRITDPDHGGQMIVYYVDKRIHTKIKELTGLSH